MYRKIMIYFFCGLLWLAPAAALAENDAAADVDLTDPKVIALQKDAARSLILARQSIKKNGFYCAKIEVNIWKNLAMRSGTFDESVYEELNRELYQKSLDHFDKWFTYYIKRGFYNDAKRCLQNWRLQSLEINKFDEALYAEKDALLETINPQNKGI